MNSEELVMWEVQGKGFLVEKIALVKTQKTMDLICDMFEEQNEVCVVRAWE